MSKYADRFDDPLWDSEGEKYGDFEDAYGIDPEGFSVIDTDPHLPDDPFEDYE